MAIIDSEEGYSVAQVKLADVSVLHGIPPALHPASSIFKLYHVTPFRILCRFLRQQSPFPSLVCRGMVPSISSCSDTLSID